MPIKGPLLPRDTPSPPIDDMQSQSLDDGSPRRGGESPIVYEAHKRSSKLSVLKVSTRKRTNLPSNNDDGRVPQSAEEAVSAYEQYSAVSTRPEPFDRKLWSEPPGQSVDVRGRNYLNDGKKYPSQRSLFRLVTADIVEVTRSLPRGSMCLHPDGRIQPALNGNGGDGFPPFLFCVNLRIPHPKAGREYHIVGYFAVDDLSLIDGTGSCPSSKIASRFFFGDDDGIDKYRDRTFKLVPRIVEGNTLVKKAVGSKPVLMGRKLKQSYVRGERFFELIIDVGSDKIADKIVKMCIGYAKSIVVDLAFILEGTDQSVLPERVMGTFRLNNIDFKNQRRVVEV
eukprot:CAMPEP_0113551646 /NCGR_PEP_ID=MMETSP0015_2-20120614/14635_1 /TAXON_ID=2838 /ORGANISM="Odontella" /LENGTH=338 /DNA_ID=CAMNT_0000452551 /DNA_START=73 /DNA_END=1089 /DNA_ORIENTATION=- /assembly_acc=CAM_ASM_000160